MLMVAHDVNPLHGYLDRVMYIAGGGAMPAPRARWSPRETLTRLYGTPVEVLRTADGRLVVVGQPEAPYRGTSHEQISSAPRSRLTPVNPHLTSTSSTTSAAVRVPVHGQRPRGGDARGGAGRGRRLVHGAAAADLRRAHAGRDGLPGRGRRGPRGHAAGFGYFGFCLRGGAGHRAARRRRAGTRTRRSRRPSASSRPSCWPPDSSSSRSTAAAERAGDAPLRHLPRDHDRPGAAAGWSALARAGGARADRRARCCSPRSTREVAAPAGFRCGALDAVPAAAGRWRSRRPRRSPARCWCSRCWCCRPRPRRC